MGWKNVRDHFDLGYIQVTEKGICVGSGYVNGLITISLDGSKVTLSDGCATGKGQKLVERMKSDPELLKQLVNSPDKFEKFIPVYRVDKTTGTVIEEYCEELGWPNLTHSGNIMYENVYFRDRDEAVSRAKYSIIISIESMHHQVAEAERNLAEARTLLETYLNSSKKMESDYPHIPVYCSP